MCVKYWVGSRLHVAVYQCHNILCLAASYKAPISASMKSAESVNLHYFARCKLKYLSQFEEYNCNQAVLRKVTSSAEGFLKSEQLKVGLYVRDNLEKNNVPL